MLGLLSLLFSPLLSPLLDLLALTNLSSSLFCPLPILLLLLQVLVHHLQELLLLNIHDWLVLLLLALLILLLERELASKLDVVLRSGGRLLSRFLFLLGLGPGENRWSVFSGHFVLLPGLVLLLALRLLGHVVQVGELIEVWEVNVLHVALLHAPLESWPVLPKLDIEAVFLLLLALLLLGRLLLLSFVLLRRWLLFLLLDLRLLVDLDVCPDFGFLDSVVFDVVKVLVLVVFLLLGLFRLLVGSRL